MNYTLGSTQSITRYADLDRGPRKAAIIFVASLAIFLLGFVAWMNFASLDISVSARGSVVPSSKVQQIQSLEGGIIREITIREGQEVKHGDLLVRLENLGFNSELGELKQNYWAQVAAIARLDAELEGRSPEFPDDVKTNAPDLLLAVILVMRLFPGSPSPAL